MTKGCIFTLWTTYKSLLTSKTSFTVFRSITNALKTVIHDALKQTIPIHVQKNLFFEIKKRYKWIPFDNKELISNDLSVSFIYTTKLSTNRALFNK